MDIEVLKQILNDLQEIKADIRWFKEREESRQHWEATENAAKGLANVDSHREKDLAATYDRARALAAFASGTEHER